MRTQVTFDAADPHALAAFWAEVLGTEVEGKVAKNRVHLDIHVEPDRKADEVARVTGLGAELIATHSDRGPVTYVLRDPEGNEFCLH